VVYGDIRHQPLYALQIAISGKHGPGSDSQNVSAWFSLVVWSITAGGDT